MFGIEEDEIEKLKKTTEKLDRIWRIAWKVGVVLGAVVIALWFTIHVACAATWVVGTSDTNIEGQTVTAYVQGDQGNYTQDIVGVLGGAHYRNYYMIDVESIPNYTFQVGDIICIEISGMTVNVTTSGNGWDLAQNLGVISMEDKHTRD